MGSCIERANASGPSAGFIPHPKLRPMDQVRELLPEINCVRLLVGNNPVEALWQSRRAGVGDRFG